MNPLLQNSNFSAWSISFSSLSPPHPEFPLNFLRQTLTQCNQMGELHRVTWMNPGPLGCLGFRECARVERQNKWDCVLENLK